jgi:toxin secretion/phage lysis holin
VKEYLIKYGMGGIVSVFSYLFGGVDAMLTATFTAILLDYVSALIVCGYEGKLNSSVGRKGMFSKLMYLVLIVAGQLVDTVLGTDYVRFGVCIFIISNEFLSVLENAGRLPNVKIPDVLRNAIEVLKNRGDKK